ncbi:ClpXP protease specificity-enhancing factor [Colwellia sp. MB02u-14]|uniref:ClpXP protease specificity-enhancing factor n=1 Tax=Colwellia sp. MB02u-14 TaxID=2759815 RepID=UPI0021753132|nr:ClpXP protease specificity-enhancing factor [Colwellia sp. MB02u-14]
MASPEMTSNKPYIIRAFYQWISDNQLTPYIAVDVSIYGVLVPMAYVSDGQIVLNVSMSAVGSISLGDHAIEVSARFGGKLEHIVVPYGAIAAIYAKENGAGTSLAIEHSEPELSEDITPVKPVGLSSVSSDNTSTDNTNSEVKSPKVKGKPSLKVIK